MLKVCVTVACNKVSWWMQTNHHVKSWLFFLDVMTSWRYNYASLALDSDQNSENLEKNHSKCHFPLKIGNYREVSGNFWKDQKFNFRLVAILEIYLLVEFLLFEKVTTLLILWEFDRRIHGKFHDDVIVRPHDLLTISVLLK